MRQTRKDTQQATRQRLLSAAHSSIASGGCGAASIRSICEAAGHTQGAFYSNFATKDDLLLEIMEVHIREETAVLREIVATADAEDLDHTLALLAERLAALAAMPEWSLLAIELQLQAQRDSRFAARYNDSKASYHAEFARLLEDLIGRHRLAPALPPLQMAIGLHALWSGLVVEGTGAGTLPRQEMLLAFFRAITGCAPLPGTHVPKT